MSSCGWSRTMCRSTVGSSASKVVPSLEFEARVLMVEDPSNPEFIFRAPAGYFQAATTDADGRFRLTGIGRGRRTILGFIGPGIMSQGAQVVTGSFPKDRPSLASSYPVYDARFEHPCKPGKSMTGVVRGIDTGLPLAGIRVIARGGGPDFWVTTDQDGRYRIDGISKQFLYEVYASALETISLISSRKRSVQDSSGYESMTADIGMARGVVVTGRLIDRGTNRPVLASVSYAALRNNPHWPRVPVVDQRGAKCSRSADTRRSTVAFNWSCRRAAGSWS